MHLRHPAAGILLHDELDEMNACIAQHKEWVYHMYVEVCVCVHKEWVYHMYL